MQHWKAEDLVKEQQREWQQLYDDLVKKGTAPGAQPPPREDFIWAMSCVRRRTFSGPYVGSTLQDCLRTAGLVAGLALGNTILGLADPQKTLSAAIAVFLFNVLYEVILSRSLRQYASSMFLTTALPYRTRCRKSFWRQLQHRGQSGVLERRAGEQALLPCSGALQQPMGPCDWVHVFPHRLLCTWLCPAPGASLLLTWVRKGSSPKPSRLRRSSSRLGTPWTW
ncbi:hypothetical protein Vretifemale_20989 [Volvox reticuliferus]|uniref:Uncharacterized protein n=1 Tax=Volvox reticuliferus TaxID=1737510 RepID=A0A8J4D4I1_9CHLO|nr:hypothetical protein Vretifemale_20989 [Volvox reticuliferus]